jgi:hypothetical protein
VEPHRDLQDRHMQLGWHHQVLGLNQRPGRKGGGLLSSLPPVIVCGFIDRHNDGPVASRSPSLSLAYSVEKHNDNDSTQHSSSVLPSPSACSRRSREAGPTGQTSGEAETSRQAFRGHMDHTGGWRGTSHTHCTLCHPPLSFARGSRALRKSRGKIFVFASIAHALA